MALWNHSLPLLIFLSVQNSLREREGGREREGEREREGGRERGREREGEKERERGRGAHPVSEMRW